MVVMDIRLAYGMYILGYGHGHGHGAGASVDMESRFEPLSDRQKHYKAVTGEKSHATVA